MDIDQISEPDANHVDLAPGGADDTSEAAENVSLRPVAWLQATEDDLVGLDFEAPIAGSTSATCDALSDLYRQAAQPSKEGKPPADTAATRIFATLAAATSMHLKARERAEPFGPLMSVGDRRTAIPADFRGEPVRLLANMAARSVNPALKARLADMCWLLEPKRGPLGAAAVAAYVHTIEVVELGILKFPFGQNDGALEFRAGDLLRRALYIGWAIGWGKPETIRARDAVMRLRGQAAMRRLAAPMIWFAELDLDFSVSDPLSVAAGIEEVLAAGDVDFRAGTSLWRLAARAYHTAKQDADAHRCLAEAAEAMVAEADRLFVDRGHHAAMLASHELSNAIHQLHGIPGKRDRRTELRHRLIDVQARIPEEMSIYAHEWDVSGIAKQAEEAVGGASLFDTLFVFAGFAASPDPNALTEAAVKSIQQHPLSSLFAGVHYDKDGKVVHRSEAANFQGDPGVSAIQREISQHESVRRNIIGTAIEFARRNIMTRHFLPEELLTAILRHSAFVPQDLVLTYSRAFLRFFQGDFSSALYTLTPLLEASLRHLLKLNGHDVSIFDDATQTQQDRTISSLFEQMRDELDLVFTRAITTDIENVFLLRPGPHIRHDVAHGVLHDGAPYSPDAIYACWLIFRLCVLPLFPHLEPLRDALKQGGLGLVEELD
jgi:hypothetical protein